MSAPGSLRDLTALAITFGLTGWLLGLVVLPERLGAIRRGGITLALSVPATLAIGLPGLLLHRLGPPSLLPGLGLLGGIAAWRARRGPGDGLRTVRPAIPRLGGVAWRRLLLVSAGAALGWLAVVQPQIATRRWDGLPRDTTVWYYWWLVERVERSGGLPATIPEWGKDRPFPLEYLAATVHGATAAALAGGPDLPLMESYRLAVLVLGLLASFALWWRFLPAWWAWVAAILSMSAIKVASRFAGYRPEAFGFMLVLWSGWLLDEAIERRSARWGVLAGVVSASAFLAHAEIWLLTGPLWLGVGAGRVARHASRAGVHGATGVRTTLRAVAASVLALVLGVGGVSLATGSGGRILAVAEVGERGDAARTPRIGADPTWALFAAIARPDAIDAPPPRFCTGIWLNAAGTTRQPFPGIDLRHPPTRLALILATVLALLPIPRVPAAVRWIAVAWGIYVLGVYAGSRTFCAAYETFIPRRAGPVRLMPYYALALAGLFAALGWLGASLLTAVIRRVERRDRGPGRVAAIAAALPAPVLGLGLLLLFSPLARGPVVEPSTGLSPAAYEAYTWMDRTLPPDAVVLANAYTPGMLGALAGTYGWTDGRAPYLESPEWRSAATRALLDGRAFFRAPRTNQHLLPPEVDYVLVAAPGVSLGGSGPFPADVAALSGLERLRLVRTFGGGRIYLFEVIGVSGRASGGPRSGGSGAIAVSCPQSRRPA